MHVKDLDDCEFLCYQHDNCVSLNMKRDPDSSTGQQECELNNSTHREQDEDLTVDNAYLYRGAKVMKSTVVSFGTACMSKNDQVKSAFGLGGQSGRRLTPVSVA